MLLLCCMAGLKGVAASDIDRSLREKVLILCTAVVVAKVDALFVVSLPRWIWRTRSMRAWKRSRAARNGELEFVIPRSKLLLTGLCCASLWLAGSCRWRLR